MNSQDTPIQGNKEERATFSEVYRHYEMAKNDLDTRISDFDKKDNLFRSYIDTTNWPYNAQVFDPRIFTTLYEKTARLLANKPQGRLIPREGGDALGAKINNELLQYQWDDNERVAALPMLAKWALMDQNARKYGASFGICKWRWERQLMRSTPENEEDQPTKGKSSIFFDGPDFEPLNNRDVLANPSYSSIKNWCQVRTYPTFNELEDVNDVARSKPIYKNLDLLRESLKRKAKEGGDNRDSNYQSKNLTIKGLTDWLGKDPSFATIEVINEYRPDRWITFAPKHGIVLRDIPNPYKHQQIPVILLKYYPIDEDLYGLSEIEPVEKLQRAINAVVNQYLDAINMSLYQPLMVNAKAVQMHTLEFGPGKKWIMNDPGKDVVPYVSSNNGIQQFAETYRFLVGAMQEALGETSAMTSSMDPGQSKKTATEIKDLSMSRSARDNFNLIFLSEALKKQMMFWHKMNQQYLFSNSGDKQKIIQITGKDAIKYFQGEGLDANGLDDKAIEQLSNPDLADSQLKPEDLQTPIYPVKVGEDTVPKMTVENGGVAHLIIEKEDLAGNYDYIPDIGSMNQLASEQEIKAMHDAIAMATSVDPKTGQPSGLAAVMAKEGKKVKATDLWIDYTEKIGFKDADKYIEEDEQAKQQMELQQQAQMQQLQMGGANGNPINRGGAAPQGGGAASQGVSQNTGMEGSTSTLAVG